MGSNRARNFRRRGEGGGGDNDGDDAAAAKPSLSSLSKPKKLPVANPKKKLLSFVDDEEEEDGTPRVRVKSKSGNDRDRSSSSRLGVPSSSYKLTSGKDHRPAASSAAPPPPSNVQPVAGTYTKEALLELQKNTRTLPFSRPSTTPEPKVVLKGLNLIKPPQQQEQQTLKHVVKQVSDLDSNEEDREEPPEDVVPDQAAIEAIRAKRERIRQARAAPAPDFISLDGSTVNHAAAEGLSDEEAVFQGSFIGARPRKSDKKGVFDYGDERSVGKDSNVGELDDEDEEDKLWEEEQFKKGLGKRMDDGPNRMVNSNGFGLSLVNQPQQQHKYTYPSGAPYGRMPSASMAPTIGPAHSMDMMPISQQAELAKKALQDNVQRLKESHGKIKSSLAKTDENLSASLMNITALESSLSASGEKYIFMQKLRDFVSVICDFMQEKGSLIEEIEEQMKELNEKRASVIIERRVADNNDEMKEVEAGVKAAMAVLNERGSSNLMIAAATTAALAASASIKEQSNRPVELDEFGRDINLQKRREMECRAAARQKRRARFEAKRLSAMEIDRSYLKIDGESSTDESDSETAAHRETRDSLLKCAEKVFSDASEEYSQLSRVKERFETWKRDYSSSYRDAYMSLSAPSIFSPYVRVELLKWDPLHEDVDFFDMNWHMLLFEYGKPEGREDFAPDDADANLVPELVEKVAVPILHHQIVRCWDMLSTRETGNAVSATSLVTNYVSASSEALAELFVAIRTRLTEAVATITVPTWSPLVLKTVPNAAQVAAYRFGMSVRLMRNICLWKDVLALPVLERLALNDLLFAKILPHVRSIASNVHDAVTRTERILASLSGVWAGPSVTRDHSRKLQPLVDYVMALGRTLEKRRGSGVDDAETSGLARRLKKILVDLNQHDHAREIVRTFDLKEAV